MIRLKAVTISPQTVSSRETVDPKTGLVTGTGADAYNGMVIPEWVPSREGSSPRGRPDQFDFSRLFRGVPDHYSDIQWGENPASSRHCLPVEQKERVSRWRGRYTTRLGVSDSIFLGGNPPFQTQRERNQRLGGYLEQAARPTFR